MSIHIYIYTYMKMYIHIYIYVNIYIYIYIFVCSTRTKFSWGCSKMRKPYFHPTGIIVNAAVRVAALTKPALCRGPTGHTNRRISHPGSKAHYKGGSRNPVL